MPHSRIVELINSAPALDQSMAKELAALAEQHICIPALFASMMDTASQTAMGLVNSNINTNDGMAQFFKAQGAVTGIRAEVDRLCTMMSGGDEAHEAGLDTSPNREAEVPSQRRSRPEHPDLAEPPKSPRKRASPRKSKK